MIVFGILALFLASAFVVVVVHKYRKGKSLASYKKTTSLEPPQPIEQVLVDAMPDEDSLEEVE